MGEFIRYYKWHFIFLILVLICVVYLVFSLTSDNSPDLVVGYTGTQYVNKQTFDDFKPNAIELLLSDANGDNKKSAQLITLHGDIQSDINEALLDMIETDQYDIYITTAETFKSIEDKSVFEPVETYFSVGNKNLDTLKDSKGIEYAVSLKNNKYAENMGFLESDSLYIAVNAPKDGKLTTNKKNGRNIAQQILMD